MTFAQQLTAWGACSDGYDWATTNCKTMAEVWDKCERGGWLVWLLRKKNDISHADWVRIAVACAEHILPIFEARYPDDTRPRLAIDAAKAWLANPCEATLKAVNANAAANAAAYAAANAYAAAGAAYAYERRWQADMIRALISNPFKQRKEQGE